MAKGTVHGLQETKGQFQVRGIVSGTESQNFYTDKETKTHKPFRSINFGVQYAKDNETKDLKAMYVGFNGMVQDNVYFSKTDKAADGTKKTDIKKVAWKDRLTFLSDGYNLIGIHIGVKKKIDSTGKEVNDKKVLSQYDACKEIAENLKDDESVFVKGNVSYSTYKGNHQTRFEPSQISLCKPVDFDTEDFKPQADFTQTIVFTGINKNKEKENEFIVSAKIVTYNTIEDAEFYITNPKLANQFRKNMKPYSAIKVWGDIDIERHVDTVTSEDDVWGEENEMDRVFAPTKVRLIITGADPHSIDTELYTQDKIEEGIATINASKQAKKDYGDSDDKDDTWGSVKGSKDGEDDDQEAW